MAGRMAGHIDKLTSCFVSGWACSSYDAVDDRIQLYLDDEFVSEFSPEFVRQGLVDKGIHQSGLCAFQVSIEHLSIDLSTTHVISIRVFVEGDFIELSNSPLLWQPALWIQQLLEKRENVQGKKTLIVGLPKSGTSALTVSLESAFPDSTVYFEPKAHRGLNDLEFHAEVCTLDGPVISKCLYFGDTASYLMQVEKFYDKCIWIYRDPRDWLISNFLYIWYRSHSLSDFHFDKALALLRRKEIDPKSIDFIPMLEFERGLDWYHSKLTDCANQIQRVTQDNKWCLLRFEDFLDGNYAHLDAYLGEKIVRSQSLPDGLKRVERAVDHGYWKDWFTEKDQTLFNEKFTDVMQAMQYDLEEALNDQPSIDPKYSSQYMANLNSGALK